MTEKLVRITYVEDEPDIRTIAELALTRIGGFALQVCASGHEAVAEIPDYDPQLILLDVMMPGIDGVETLKRLRDIESTRQTPVVFMTAKAQHHETEYYHSLGVIGVISKPFDPLALPETINALWQQSRVDGEVRNAV